MADNVRVSNLQDGKHRVAYDMAKEMWLNEHREYPKLSDKDEFLDFVKECMQALNVGTSR